MTWASYIIDANLNRAREGLRVLEDLARFVLRDDVLRSQLREMRHALAISRPTRDVAADPGAASDLTSISKSPLSVLHANACRVQEALRVLEEYDGKARYARLRFETYEIHQSMFLMLRRNELRGLYIIVDPNAFDVTPELVGQAVAAKKSKLVQLRYKNAAKKHVLERARSIREQLQSDVMLIINDHVDIALACADGVHLGQNDFPVAEAVRICPAHFIVGATANNLAQAQKAQDDGASYVSMGCVFETNTKLDTSPVEMAELAHAKSILRVPFCVIGGINETNILRLDQVRPDLIAMCANIWRKEQ